MGFSGGRADGPEAVVVNFPITLGQFLKVSGLASTGGEAKQMIASGVVRVNDAIDMRRGRKLGDGDVVTAGGEAAKAVAGGPGVSARRPDPPRR